NHNKNNYKWKKLAFAADYVLYRWQGTAHRAIHDCMATRAVWHYLKDPAERSRIDAAKAMQEAG
ncbi:MAG: hypothetical protein GY703_22255, partial [Gammaproteobacteria bacterium]|nr:hypothetical protein [Gammaproteobacteria bacterium]